MSVHPIDYRYGSKEMREIFDEEKKLEQQLKVEAALVEALAELGKLPKEAAEIIKEKANTNFVKLERVKEIEEEIKHDVMALVKALSEVCGSAGKYVHLTATSYDIVDTAQALQINGAIEILLEKGEELLKNCLNVCEKYKDLIIIGRTHGQHAIPITLGFKFANYVDKIGENLKRLKEDKNYILGKFSGAVGNYTAQQIYGLGDSLEQKIMEKLGIGSADISTQVVARENISRIICDIAIFACSVEQIAKEIRNLQRTEICELSEPFGEKQVGSSTMAQKRNPINTENICGNVRIIRSCVYPALENIALEHERDLTNSASERSILPTIFVLMDEVLIRMNKVIKGLVVFPENIKKNLELTKGTIMAEAVITELTKKGMGRQEAHELLRTSSIQVFSQNCNLKEILLENKEIIKYLNKSELDRIMDYQNYVGLSIEKTDKIIQKWENFNYSKIMKPIRIHEGSAKNVLILKEPTKDSFGKGIFEFLDYFSIFDWGRFLNDPIIGKGIAMAAVSKKYFELLESAGIKTHYQGMAGSTKMNVSLVNIPQAYKNVTPDSKNYLLPIEIIFRIYTHPASSDLKKIKEGRRTYQELGYAALPEPNKKLPSLKISYSTKLEAEDRVITKEEARVLAGLTQEEINKLEELALKVNDIITNHCESVGLIHYDGKIEVAKDINGNFIVVDVMGTLDEDRFMIEVQEGEYIDVSKQFLRNWFIDNGWKPIVDAAKDRAEKEGIKDWKTFCSKPPKLPEKISRLMTEMYLADVQVRTGEKLGEKLGVKVRSLKQVAKEMYNVQKMHKADKIY